MTRSTALPAPDVPKHVLVGATCIDLPDGLAGKMLSDPNFPPNCSEFIARSPERTIYHAPAYIDFARRENGAADLLVVLSQGAPMFALPLHPDARGNWISTGYSGALFPCTDRESVLRASATAFRALLLANPRVGFRVEQSAQAPAYADAQRMALLAQLLCDERNDVHTTYTRIMQPLVAGGASADSKLTTGDASSLDNASLMSYDPDIRNQIRQALRRGMSVQSFVLDSTSTAEETERAYRRYMPVQAESFARTGMTGQTLAYWLALSNAIQRGGGTDIVVLVTDESGSDVAGVTCHAFQGRAIYWSGCSTEAGKASRANPLALHTAISMCGAMGVTAFELGRFSAVETSAKEIAIARYNAQFRGQIAPVLNLARRPQTLRSEIRSLAAVVRGRLPRIVAAARKR